MLNGDETHEGTETKNCENVKTDEMDVGFYVNLPYCVVCADSYDNGHIFELQTVAIL